LAVAPERVSKTMLALTPLLVAVTTWRPLVVESVSLVVAEPLTSVVRLESERVAAASGFSLSWTSTLTLGTA